MSKICSQALLYTVNRRLHGARATRDDQIHTLSFLSSQKVRYEVPATKWPFSELFSFLSKCTCMYFGFGIQWHYVAYESGHLQTKTRIIFGLAGKPLKEN